LPNCQFPNLSFALTSRGRVVGTSYGLCKREIVLPSSGQSLSLPRRWRQPSPEALQTIHQSTLPHIPEDSVLHQQRTVRSSQRTHRFYNGKVSRLTWCKETFAVYA
jgi:hypothetical protein